MHVAPVLAQHLADVDDHVQLAGAIGQRLLRLGDLDRGLVAAVREADGRAHGHSGTGQDVCGRPDRIGLDANRRDAIVAGEAAALLQVGIGQHLLQERMIEHPGDVGVGIGGHQCLTC